MAANAEAQRQFIELATKALDYRHTERVWIFWFAVGFCAVGALFLLTELLANAFCRSTAPPTAKLNGVDVTVGLDAKSLAIRNLTAGGLLVVLATILLLSLIWSQLKQTVTDGTSSIDVVQLATNQGGGRTPVNSGKGSGTHDGTNGHNSSLVLSYGSEWRPDDCDKAIAKLNRLVYPNDPEGTRNDPAELETFEANVKECRETTLPKMLADLRELQTKEGDTAGRDEALRGVIKNLEDMQVHLDDVATNADVATLLDSRERSKLGGWIDSLSRLKTVAPSPPAPPPAEVDVPE